MNDFSFVKLREEIINKSGIYNNPTDLNNENPKKLKFEPNINISRNISDTSVKSSIISDENKESKVVNLNEISSRFSNKDSLNLLKKPLPKKDQKTIIINSESLLKTNVDEKSVKKSSKGQDIKSAISNLISKDPNSYLPTTLPFKCAEDDSGTLDLNENDIYLFQFPRIMPMNIEHQKKYKEEELDTEEPSYDQNGFLINNDFENVMKTLPNNSQLGKLKIYKSGKIKLHIGNINYDVTPGVTCKFAQELCVISSISNEAFLLGKIREKKLVVTPELNLK